MQQKIKVSCFWRHWTTLWEKMKGSARLCRLADLIQNFRSWDKIYGRHTLRPKNQAQVKKFAYIIHAK
jgi:hypothetical protein